jgi:preprotein translocase subunit SecG
MGDLSNFEREQIVGASLAGTFVTKTTSLLGVLRLTISKVISAAYTSHAWEDNISKEEQWEKINIGRKRLSYI